MKRIVRGRTALVTILVLSGTGAAVFYTRSLALPRPLAIEVDSTPERVARGKDIFNLGHCDVCHSTRDFSRIGGPPRPTGSVPQPDRGDDVRYGAYLVGIGQCMGCHGTDFSGGKEFHEAPDIVVVSANISPDVETGIGLWTERNFLSRFYKYR